MSAPNALGALLQVFLFFVTDDEVLGSLLRKTCNDAQPEPASLQPFTLHAKRRPTDHSMMIEAWGVLNPRVACPASVTTAFPPKPFFTNKHFADYVWEPPEHVREEAAANAHAQNSLIHKPRVLTELVQAKTLFHTTPV